jgi:Ca2+-transporting ATPase
MTSWHAQTPEAALAQQRVTLDQGLSDQEIAERRRQHGLNLLTPKKGRGPLLRFLLQFHQALIYILLAAAAVTAALNEWVDCAVIFGVVLVNAIVGFLQESKALSALAALARTMKTEATVVRNGQRLRIDASQLVPGDIVVLQSGDKAPADLRLIKTRDLQIDESALTGESVPVQKDAAVTLDEKTALADRKAMAYASTLVTYGQGTGLVVATGDCTEIGRISGLLASTEELQTPLTRKIAAFSHMLLFVIIGLALVAFGVGVARGESAAAMFMAAVALAVGAIPEGMPAALTITLAIGVARMARRKAIIRKLPAVETLGSTTVICSDKTGTLTQNQMTVQQITLLDTCLDLEGAGYAPAGRILLDGHPVNLTEMPGLAECLRAGVLCNDSVVRQGNGQWQVHGDPTEGALLVAAAKAGLQTEELRTQFPRLDAIPFESQLQYMATLNAGGDARPPVLYVKGAVEVVLALCRSAMRADGACVPLDVTVPQAHVTQMAARGLRVLALARAEFPAGATSVAPQDIKPALTFLGLQGMMDPPRPEAIRAVAACHRAGIRVKMITGDHVVTAKAIAQQIGLAPGGADPVAMNGLELAETPDDALPGVAAKTDVFARVTPEQKLRLVMALQQRGHVVAMTGDGVNDGPALRRANIGVAMGISGTEVAKEASDMVLADDNFASIEAAVEEGRAVFANLTKFIVWTLPTNAGEGLVILAAIVMGASLPILPVQILWINMTTAVLLGLMLAFEPKEPGIMDRPPRDPKAPILTGRLLGRILLVSTVLLAGAFGLFEWELSAGASHEYARTVAVNVFVFGEMFYLFTCRSLTVSFVHLGVFTNIPLWLGVLAMTALQILFTYAPFMNRLFHSTPISLASWGWVILAGIVIMALVSAEKMLMRAWGR